MRVNIKMLIADATTYRTLVPIKTSIVINNSIFTQRLKHAEQLYIYIFIYTGTIAIFLSKTNSLSGIEKLSMGERETCAQMCLHDVIIALLYIYVYLRTGRGLRSESAIVLQTRVSYEPVAC